MKEECLEVRNVSIKYKIRNSFSIKKSFIKDRSESIKEYEAVRNVSFNLKRGDVVGLIGNNGAGKSTLLRAIAGIYRADKGTIDLKGNRASLMALGVGFNPQLTGKENVILSGMLLGMTKKEMEKRLDEICVFSELGKFIEMPVLTYSSGMYSKLAFSITACIDTDIMLVDEVLSVGDEAFQKKSFDKMKELIANKDQAAIIVSHNTNVIQDFCNRVIWLNDGRIMEMGTAKNVIDNYHRFLANV